MEVKMPVPEALIVFTQPGDESTWPAAHFSDEGCQTQLVEEPNFSFISCLDITLTILHCQNHQF